MTLAAPRRALACVWKAAGGQVVPFVFEAMETDEWGNRLQLPLHKMRVNTTGFNLGVVALDLQADKVWVDEIYTTETTADP